MQLQLKWYVFKGQILHFLALRVAHYDSIVLMLFTTLARLGSYLRGKFKTNRVTSYLSSQPPACLGILCTDASHTRREIESPSLR